VHVPSCDGLGLACVLVVSDLLWLWGIVVFLGVGEVSGQKSSSLVWVPSYLFVVGVEVCRRVDYGLLGCVMGRCVGLVVAWCVGVFVVVQSNVPAVSPYPPRSGVLYTVWIYVCSSKSMQVLRDA